MAAEACGLRGPARLVLDCYDRPKWVKEFLSILCDYTLKLCRQLDGVPLDLIENVPPLGADHPLLKFDNVIITPYCAWYTEDSIATLREIIASEIARVLTGYYPKAIVNPEVKPTARAGRLMEEPQ